MTLASRWDRIATTGARPDDRPGERRRLRLTNQGAVIGGASCLFFAGAFALAGSCFSQLIELNLLLVALDFGVLTLTARGHRTLAKLALLVPAHALILLASITVGLGAGFHYYFFLFGGLAFLLFGERETTLRFSAALGSLGCTVHVCLHAPQGTDIVELTPMALRVIDIVSAIVVLSTLLFVVQIFTSDTERAEESLAEEHGRSERLLLNILPATISTRLKAKETPIADGFSQVTVLFADLVGFTELSQRLSPAELVAMLNDVFSSFDDLALSLGLEKIKTIGDCYMAAAGLPEQRVDHVEAAARMALGIREALAKANARAGYDLHLRIGLHTGPVIAGVIGKRKFIYDVWGDTVNVASRMESTGAPDEIQVTQPVRDALGEMFVFEARGSIKVKGRGQLETYFLRGARVDADR